MFRSAIRRTSTGDVNASVAEKDKELDTETVIRTDSDDKPQGDRPSEDVQRGVQEVEAVTLTWSKPTLIAVFIKHVLILYPYHLSS